ncbi:MAG: hypothetical protein KGK18_00990, partial [Burkholderiales bacterium]|nr:hypothetical protein [Burkholderiales bacterium]
CLYELGCKGPVTYNACGVMRWNNGVSYPIQSGHGCIGCSEPNFWDNGPFYERGMFAKSFDDEGARQGWCLYELGCKGPVTYNACATQKWNGGVSFPIQSGHGCIGCSEPHFWDRGGLYKPLSAGTTDVRKVIGIAAAAGVALGAGSAALARQRRAKTGPGAKPAEG